MESSHRCSLFLCSSIALDPKKGVFYYSTWASENSKGQIMLSWMDGTHRRVFVDKCDNKTACIDIQWPTSLTIDYIDQKLYWCDPRMEKIERIGLDGQNREVIIKRSAITGNFYPFSMAYHNNFIYFTDISSGNITKVSLQNISDRKYVFLISKYHKFT